MSWEGFLWGEEYKKQDLGEQATKAVGWALCSPPLHPVQSPSPSALDSLCPLAWVPPRAILF